MVIDVGAASLTCSPLPPDRSPAGTTWHTAGLVWRLRPSDTEIQLLAHTHQVLVCCLLPSLHCCARHGCPGRPPGRD